MAGSDGVALMARPKGVPKPANVRLTAEAHRLAEIARGYTRETLGEYISRVVCEHAQADIERLHAELTSELKRKAEAAENPPRPRRKGTGGE